MKEKKLSKPEKPRSEEQSGFRGKSAEHLKELSEIMRNFAHEIRNPLASIRAGAQRIEEKILPDNPSHKYALLIIREVDRLERIIKGLLKRHEKNE